MGASLEKRIERLTRREEETYRSRTRASLEKYTRLSRRMPEGVNYRIRRLRPHPLYIAEARDVRVRDVDGNWYVDYWMGHGAHIMGHTPRWLGEVVGEVYSRGYHFGYPSSLLEDYVDAILRAYPSMDAVKLTNTGTDANNAVMRAVRAYTGREKIVKMKGGWHGGSEALIVDVHPPYRGVETAGTVDCCVSSTITVEYNDLEALERALKEHRPAAVIMEPVLGAGGAIGPRPGYLREVRRLTEEHGVLLVFDEVITGFRLAPGGAVEFYGVEPDLVILGKIVGGGSPSAGAVLGKWEYMKCFDTGSWSGTPCFVGGTFSGNNLTLALGREMITRLLGMRGEYERAREVWREFAREAERTCGEETPCHVTGDSLLVGLHFTRRRPWNPTEAHELRWSREFNYLHHLYQRNRGALYLTEDTAHFLPSLLHSREHARLIVSNLEELLGELVRS